MVLAWVLAGARAVARWASLGARVPHATAQIATPTTASRHRARFIYRRRHSRQQGWNPQFRPDREQTEYDEHAERGRRLDVLQRAEHEFDPIPFDSEAARAYGQVIAAVIGTGRTPRRRTAGLMIASTAIAAGLPLYTTNPDDFGGLDDLLAVVPVTCPRVHRERVRP